MLLASDCRTVSVSVEKVLKRVRKVAKMSKLCFAIVESWNVCMWRGGCGVLILCVKLIRRVFIF